MLTIVSFKCLKNLEINELLARVTSLKAKIEYILLS